MTSYPRSTSRVPRRLWVVGLLPCLLGVAMFSRALGHELMQAWRVRAWIEVPAHILQVDNQLIPEAKGYRRLTARYAYRYDGKDYTSTAVLSAAVTPGQHQGVLKRLQECQRSGQDYPCFVDPAQPRQTVLKWDRTGWWLREDFFYVVIFGGIVVAAGFYALRPEKPLPNGAPRQSEES